ncbi:MAG: phage tail protein [Candidatus Sedimenticola endophacoides]
MSNTLIPVITQVGLQAVFNASNSGLQAEITEIALGDQGWQPDSAATGLRNERRRIQISNGERIAPTQIHITAVEDGTQLEYWVREVGFYLADGSLLAIWSHETQALAYKAAGVDLLLAFDMALAALPAESVTVVGTGGVSLPPATTVKLGVMRFATTTEAKAGTIHDC